MKMIKSKLLLHRNPDSIEVMLQKTSWDFNDREILTAQLQHRTRLEASELINIWCENLKQITELLSLCPPALRTLDLSGADFTRFNKDDVTQFAKSLQHYPQLVLDISNINVDKGELIKFFANSGHRRKIIFGLCEQTSKDALIEAMPQIKAQELFIYPNSDPVALAAVGLALEKNHSIISLGSLTNDNRESSRFERQPDFENECLNCIKDSKLKETIKHTLQRNLKQPQKEQVEDKKLHTSVGVLTKNRSFPPPVSKPISDPVAELIKGIKDGKIDDIYIALGEEPGSKQSINYFHTAIERICREPHDNKQLLGYLSKLQEFFSDYRTILEHILMKIDSTTYPISEQDLALKMQVLKANIADIRNASPPSA